jgi:glycosyltransferase involved in cell wall biosynthesis
MHKEVANQNRLQKTFVLENYFEADMWKYIDRPLRNKTVFGKVSRDDVMKFGDNFPIFYDQVCEGLNCEYSILGWSDSLSSIYSWYEFNDKWRLYATNAMPTHEWFVDLDVFLYNCNFKFVENQSRAIMESQLTGAPVIAPRKWNFPNMIIENECGFLWDNLDQAKDAARHMCDTHTRKTMGKKASEYAKDIWCDKNKYIAKWDNLLNLAGQNIEVKS